MDESAALAVADVAILLAEMHALREQVDHSSRLHACVMQGCPACT